MDFSWGDEHRAFRDEVRTFIRAQWERDDEAL